MCFSATASFMAAASRREHRHRDLVEGAPVANRALLPIAAFPTLFALQQGVEGFLWLDLARPTASACRPFLMHAFIGYAEVFWPAFAPLAAWLIEPEQLAAAIDRHLPAHRRCAFDLSAREDDRQSLHGVGRKRAHRVPETAVSYPTRNRNSVRDRDHDLAPVVVASRRCSCSRPSSSAGFAVACVSYHLAYISVWCFFAAIASVHRLSVRAPGRTGPEPMEEMMIRTPVCDLMDIEHPIALGGMGSVYSPDLVAAVSNAGGFGAMGCHHLNAEQIRAGTAALRERTNKPFALNFLLFDVNEDRFAAALALRPKAMAFAWPRPEQDLKSYVGRAHDAGCKVTFMANGVPEAVKAARGGRRRDRRAGHRRRRPCRLDGEHGAHADGGRCGGADAGADRGRRRRRARACGGDRARRRRRAARHALPRHRGVAAAPEFQAGDRGFRRPRHGAVGNPRHRRRQGVAGRDVALAAQPLHRAMGRAANGCCARSRRRRSPTSRRRARRGDVHEAPLSMGQDAGLINDIPPAGEIVRRIAQEAEEILAKRLPKVLKNSAAATHSLILELLKSHACQRDVRLLGEPRACLNTYSNYIGDLLHVVVVHVCRPRRSRSAHAAARAPSAAPARA